MQDPILEALTFSLESELHVQNEQSVDEKLKDSSQSGSSPLSTTTSSESLLNLNCRIPCLIPGCGFVSDVVKDAGKAKESNLLEHLLRAHHFVIDGVDQIANLPKYMNYWRGKLEGGKLEDYCFVMKMDHPIIYEDVGKGYNLEKFRAEQKSEGSSLASLGGNTLEDNKFFMLTSVLPEDNALRQKLWNERLEFVLEMNRLEREQADFNRQCLFCKEVSTGNRLSLFQHMGESHNFHFGQPDNVVFVNELLDYINDKLNAKECIYCGKIFKDKTVLREHMRKKQHKRINPSNGEYDKFYIINYLEPGKSWKILDEEDQEDDRREEEWMETNNEETSIVCLFCSFQNVNFDTIVSHMKTDHCFDFNGLSSKMSFYQKVKVVNFIRRNVHQNVCLYCEKKFFERTALLSHFNAHCSGGQDPTFPDSTVWDRAEYFFPTYENDQFLILLDRENGETSQQCSEQESMDQDCNTVVIPEDLPLVCENKFLKDEFSL